MRPAYITATRSAVSAITPMSWVMSITAAPWLRRQLLQNRDDLRLHRDVERGRRLVGDDQGRLGAERERDHDALAHAAGEFMRIAVDPLLGRGDADLAEPGDRPLPRLLSRVSGIMRQDRLGELVADRAAAD